MCPISKLHMMNNNVNEDLKEQLKQAVVDKGVTNKQDRDGEEGDFDENNSNGSSSERDRAENSSSSSSSSDEELGDEGEKRAIGCEDSSTTTLKFTIDMNTLKADMKRKSAKLLSKLSGSSACAVGAYGVGAASSGSSMLKQIVNELNVMEEKYQAAAATATTTSKSACTNVDVPLSSNLVETSLRLDDLINSIEPRCLTGIQFRCESKNVEFKQKIDELKSKLAAAKSEYSAGKIFTYRLIII